MAEGSVSVSTIRAGGYCRISSDPNDKRHGVTRQREDITALCEVKGWAVAGFYEDNDRSASNGKDRPEWDRLLADVKAGKIDAIAAWDQDRGWRMMSELEDLRKFFTGLGRHVPLATTGQGDIDLYSPTGILAAQIKTAVSEHEISMMKVRMRRAARQRAELGIPRWRRAFGYIDTPAGPVPDPQIAAAVKDGYRAILAGAALKEVAAMWNADESTWTQQWKHQTDEAGNRVLDAAGKPVLVCHRKQWNEQIVQQFLRNPRNAGLRFHHGEEVGKGRWEPLVDEQMWRATQAAMDSRPNGGRRGRRAVRIHLLTGVIDCGKCGHYLSGVQTATRKLTYTCKRCRGVAIRADDVEPLLYQTIGERLAKPDAVDLLKAEIHDAAEAAAIREEKATLYGELEKLAVERANRLLTGEQVKIATEIVQQQIDALDRKQQSQERLRIFDGIPLGSPKAVAAVKKLSPDRFRAVLSVLCKVTIAPVGKDSKRWRPERVVVDPL